MTPRRKCGKRQRSDREAQAHSQKAESRCATAGLIVKRAVGLDPPTAKDKVSETDASGSEEQPDETDELLDWLRPLEKRLWLHDC